MKNLQPELPLTTSAVEVVECTGAELHVLLERCKVVGLLACVGTGRWKATVYPKRQRKERTP